jgi:putative ABC transport system permease protein
MIRSQIKIAFRNLIRRKAYAITNIFGLSIGMACCLLITLYVLDELSFDNFHEHAGNLYRITTKADIGGRQSAVASTNEHIGEVIADEIPEIKASVRVRKHEDWTVEHEGDFFTEKRVISVDTNFFKVFTYHFIEGDPATALNDVDAIILTEETALKYFSKSRGLVGKSIVVNNKLFEITGVLAEPPRHAHFHFNMIFPYRPEAANTIDWTSVRGVMSTYVLVHEGSAPVDIEKKLFDVFLKYHPDTREYLAHGGAANFKFKFDLQPLRSIHLRSHLMFEMEPNGNLQNVYILSAIAVLILLIACTNFINLVNAFSLYRAKEVGVRKALGSNRLSLIRQFLLESFMLCLSAMTVAIGLVLLLRRPFSHISGKEISFSLLDNANFYLAVTIIFFVTGIMAGLYPAIFLARFQPVTALRDKASGSGSSGYFKNGLIVFQFVITVGLMIATIVIYSQLQYLNKRSLGLSYENVLVIENKLGKSYEIYFKNIESNLNIRSVSASSQSPHSITGIASAYLGESEDAIFQLKKLYVDEKFLTTMDIALESGRNFQSEIMSDREAVLLNEEAIRMFGFKDAFNGEMMIESKEYHVIGVVKDFHFESMHEKIKPLMMLLTDGAKVPNVLEVRIKSEDVASVVSFLKEQWTLVDNVPFNYSFLNENIHALYEEERRLGSLFSIFSALAIFLACLGLFALAAHAINHRMKEIGVRKVMGASMFDIFVILSGGFITKVFAAFIIAIPISYIVVHRWLEGFAYQIDIKLWFFLLPGFIVVVTSGLIIAYQVMKASGRNLSRLLVSD